MADPIRSPSAPAAGSPQVTVASTAPSKYAVSGPLTFATARAALAGGIESFASASGSPIEVDFAGVEAADSAGLAVLLEWLAWGRRNGRELRYTRVPEAICAIARISEVESLLLRR